MKIDQIPFEKKKFIILYFSEFRHKEKENAI